MKLIMFDIDGTLTRTDVADEVCFVHALQDVFGFSGIDTDWSVYPHCSDSAIQEAVFMERLGRAPSTNEIDAMQARFMDLLAAETRVRLFDVIPGARKMPHGLLSEGWHAISLASGAWECSARLKLATAGLDFPDLAAAFADDGHAQEAIMAASLARARQVYSRDKFDQVIYVGDGVWDGRAARNLGHPFLGIAESSAKAEKLRNEGDFQVMADFSYAAAFSIALENAVCGGETSQ